MHCRISRFVFYLSVEQYNIRHATDIIVSSVLIVSKNVLYLTTTHSRRKYDHE